MHHSRDFHTVSYNRFVELQQKVVVKIALFLQICCLGKCTGISFKNKRALNLKLFNALLFVVNNLQSYNPCP